MHALLFAPVARGMELIGTYILLTTLLVVFSARASASLVANVIATKLLARERVYAGHETKKRTSTPRRIKVVARQTKTTTRQRKAIQEAFEEIDQVEVTTSIGVVKLISLQEMPMLQMRQFMMTPGDKKMVVLMDILQLCLINPNDWDKISVMPIKEVNRLIKSWMDLSDGNPQAYDEEDEEENE